MKKLILLSILLLGIYEGYAQKKHQFGIGMDYGMYMSNPKDWSGSGGEFFSHDRINRDLHLYPSLHYTYKNTWHLTLMYQNY